MKADIDENRMSPKLPGQPVQRVMLVPRSEDGVERFDARIDAFTSGDFTRTRTMTFFASAPADVGGRLSVLGGDAQARSGVVLSVVRPTMRMEHQETEASHPYVVRVVLD